MALKYTTETEVFTLFCPSVLQPALPNTARCVVCGEGEFDESNPSTHSLMECTLCSQIVHRQCVKVSLTYNYTMKTTYLSNSRSQYRNSFFPTQTISSTKRTQTVDEVIFPNFFVCVGYECCCILLTECTRL